MRLPHPGRLARELPGFPTGAVIGIAFLVHVVTSWFHAGFLNADEHYQILEFAWYRLGHEPASALAWEFPARIRPALQPAIAAAAIHVLETLGWYTPFAAAFLLRFVSSLLGLWVTVAIGARVLPSIAHRALKRFAFVGSLLFWVAPGLHGRFSAESWGGLWLFAGICFALDALGGAPDPPARANAPGTSVAQASDVAASDTGVAQASSLRFPGRRDACPTLIRQRPVLCALAAGASWGIAFYCRFQVGFALAGIAVWLLAIRRAPLRLVAAMAAGGAALLAANVVIDHWFYGAWVLTPVNYFRANILEGKAATFGTSPAWVTAMPFLVVMLPPFSLVFAAAIVAGLWYARRHVLVWSFAPFVAAHALVAHKEPRFMVPMIFGIVPLLAVSLDRLPPRVIAGALRWTRSRVAGRLALQLLWLSNGVALLVVTLVPINDRAALLQKLWEEGRESPVTVYAPKGAPYDDQLPLNFYRAPGVRVVPTDGFGQPLPLPTGTGGRSFVLYEGMHPPRGSWSCQPVTWMPPMLVEADPTGLLSAGTLWSLCQPSTSSASAQTTAPAPRRRVPPRPSPD